MALFPRIRRPVVALLSLLGCGEGTTPMPSPSQPPEPPSFRTAPIAFGAYEPPGTYFVTLEQGAAKRINDSYDFKAIALSPDRERLVQVTVDPQDGIPRGSISVFEVAEDGERLGNFLAPEDGLFQLLGWADDETLVFETEQGIERVDMEGERVGGFEFPDWVNRDRNGYRCVLSPDRARLAYVPSRAQDDGFEPQLAIVEADSGEELDRWPLDNPVLPVWADDDHLLVIAAKELFVFELGEPAPSTALSLPFQPCGPRRWIEPGEFLVAETAAGSDFGACSSASYLVSLDGEEVTPREDPMPVAYSPAGERVLILDPESHQLVVTKPDGSARQTIEGIPEPHAPSW